MDTKSRDNRLSCIFCKFVRPDKSMGEKNWMAYECGNVSSEYYKSLLNVTPDGNKLERISWSGCVYAERRVIV